MATETLRPNEAGDLTEWTPSAGDNYATVNEVSPDEDTTYVEMPTGGLTKKDLYNLPASSGSGTINSVTVYNRVKCVEEVEEYHLHLRPYIKTVSTEYQGDFGEILDTYANISHIWNTNPNTGSAWIWTQIDALQIGIKGYQDGQLTFRCTQVYVEVDYTLAETAYDTMVGNPTSWTWQKCDYGQSEKCPVGSETNWIWDVPTSEGPDKTPQGSPTSFLWDSE